MAFSLPPDSLAFSLLQAARVVAAVEAGHSLAEGLLDDVPAPARPAVQDIVYGHLRRHGRAAFFLSRLLERPLPVPEVAALLAVALYRLETWPEDRHTVVDQAVEAAGQIARGKFKGLVNGVLRGFLRREDELLNAVTGDEVSRWGHPLWWLLRLRAAYPKTWRQIAEAGNQPPPMALRVNRRRNSREAVSQALAERGMGSRPWADWGLLLDAPQPVERLPGFAEGQVSVQDPGAMRAASLLAPSPGSRVLDACAAPGGKTAHLLEQADLKLLALDLKESRCRRIRQNLSRLGLEAQVKVGDATRPATWWDGQPFDAILADVPCSASGVVRRHPDAKLLRRDEDVASFALTQSRLLDALWPLLAPGGRFLYATCSVFPEENGEQIQAFLHRHPDAGVGHEESLLPEPDHDGFYYCLLHKAA